MLAIKNLSFSYRQKRKDFKVFEDLNHVFEKGLNIILGPNGAGKSTLLKSIFGLLDYDGDIFYGGDSITAMKTEDKTKLMSYLPQMDLAISSLTVMEMVILGRLPELGHRISDEDLDIVMTTLKSLNIEHLATRNFTELSGGQKKLVFIAQTLVRTPKLMLLDEPVNSLDLQKQLELCQLLKNIVDGRQVDVIVVLHDINLAARYADQIIVFDGEGALYSAGKPHEVITTPMLQEVYGVHADLSHDDKGIPFISPICSIRCG